MTDHGVVEPEVANKSSEGDNFDKQQHNQITISINYTYNKCVDVIQK